jgi:hypothetical protein
MSDSQIDEAILAFVENRWRKVAMVVGRVASTLGDGSFGNLELNRRVAARIEALVEAERLVSQGDLKKWRFSEVRRP